MQLLKIRTIAFIAVTVLLSSACDRKPVNASGALDLSWRIAQPTEFAFTNARPQVTILPTKFKPMSNWRIVLAPDGKCMGITMTPEQIIQTAFGQSPAGLSIVTDPVITVVDATLPANGYDFISSLPENTTNALQKAVMKKFGVRPDYEMIETNVYVLSVQHPEPEKLKGLPPWRPSPKWPHQHHPGDSMREFAGTIQARLNVPVIDETGLTNNFRFNFTWPRQLPEIPPVEELNKALLDQLGLQLNPDIRTVKMFVIKRAD